MSNKNPNVEGIVQFKRQQSDLKKEKVLQILEYLKQQNEPISKAKICLLAGVSKTFIFSYPKELIEPINLAIVEQNNKLRISVEKPSISDNSKDKVIESLKRRINSLEEENKRLKKENEILYGKLSSK